MSKPTGLDRDSSLWIEYGPRDTTICFCGIKRTYIEFA
jgi:hypothetical protein